MNLYTHVARAFAIAGVSLSMAVAQVQPGTPGSSPHPRPHPGIESPDQGPIDRTDQSRRDQTRPDERSTDRTGAGSQTDQSEHPTAGAAGEETRARADESRLGSKDLKFMTEAAQGSMMEVQLGQLAQEKASSDAVKEYGRRLQQDHEKANEQLKQIAEERNVTLPSDPGKHQKQLDKLQNLSGEQFDRAFLRMQVDHHKKDIKKFRSQSERSMDSGVKEFAQTTLPVLEEHLQQAQQLSSGQGTRSRSQETSGSQETSK